MPSHGDALTGAEHQERAAGHEVVARALHEAAGDPWAAVPYFYSAYHLVKAALHADPIFDDPARLSVIRGCPAMGDRFARTHHGYMQGGAKRVKVWGVSDLVAALYKSVSPVYSQLHEASCDVRYYRGLAVPLDKIASALDRVRDDYQAGSLVAA